MRFVSCTRHTVAFAQRQLQPTDPFQEVLRIYTSLRRAAIDYDIDRARVAIRTTRGVVCMSGAGRAQGNPTASVESNFLLPDYLRLIVSSEFLGSNYLSVLY